MATENKKINIEDGQAENQTEKQAEENAANEAENGKEKKDEKKFEKNVSDEENEGIDNTDDKEVIPEEPKESDDVRYMRLAADFQNFKRRVEKEKKDIYAYANEKIAVDIIDVMDNFERAMVHSEESSDKSFAEGMGMIMKQLKTVLDKHEILEIQAEGKEFDPNFHNAVMTEESADAESGTVTQVFQKGYTLKGKVIRPAMVKVAQ